MRTIDGRLTLMLILSLVSQILVELQDNPTFDCCLEALERVSVQRLCINTTAGSSGACIY